MVGADLFEYEKSQYLRIVDYSSRYPEMVKLVSTTPCCNCCNESCLHVTVFLRLLGATMARNSPPNSLLNSLTHTISIMSRVILVTPKVMARSKEWFGP